MAKKKNNKQKKVTFVRPKKPTPFRDVGGIVGSQLGGMFRLPMLKGVGRWLGTGIGSIFGSGDYSLVGDLPRSNVLMNGAQVPQFSTTSATNVVCHREYLGDILGTTAFTNQLFPLNPGIGNTFPWLSTIAQNYQEYKFHGLIFEFRSLITDFVTGGAPGVVIMATNYNSDLPAYTTKQQMENSEYAVATKPTLHLIHGVECMPAQTVLPQSYVRVGAVPVGQDLRTYDLGNFQLATQGNPAQLLGELWVTYCVEFFKPVLPPTPPAVTGHLSRTTVTPTNPLGQITLLLTGDLALTPANDNVSWQALPGATYLVQVNWVGTGALTISLPTPSYTNVTAVSYFFNDTASLAQGGSNGASSLTMSYSGVVRSSASTPVTANLKFAANGLFPSTVVQADVIVTLLDASAT